MRDKEYSIVVEGQKIIINFLGKTMVALREMELDEYPIYGTILSLGKELLQMQDNDHFVIIDEYQKLGIVGIKDSCTTAVDIISIVPTKKVFIKDTSKVFIYGERETVFKF